MLMSPVGITSGLPCAERTGSSEEVAEGAIREPRECAVSCELRARLGLNLKETFPFNRYVKNVSGLGERSLRGADVVAADHSKVVHRAIELRLKRVRPGNGGAEVFTFRAKTGSVRVGEIAGSGIQRFGSREQSGIRCVITTVHDGLLYVRRESILNASAWKQELERT